MQEPNESMPDSMEEVFCVNATIGNNEALRAAILNQTTGVIRRRRCVRRGLLAASLLGCYLAGAITMGLLRNDLHPAVAALPNQMMVIHPKEPVGQEEEETQLAKKDAPATEPAASDVQTPNKIPTPFEGWRNVGDYYLENYGNVSLAAASYAQAIDLATEEERAISPDKDNWLLMALKDAKIKENGYASYQQN